MCFSAGASFTAGVLLTVVGTETLRKVHKPSQIALAGIPVFCADIAPFRELGGSQVTYFPLDTDPSDLANQLTKSLESNSVFALRKRILQNYSWEKIYTNKIAPLLKKG